jgi:putative PEP-CTERM system histidine kinase
MSEARTAPFLLKVRRMPNQVIFPIFGALLSGGLAAFVLFRGDRSFANRAFMAGMLVFAVEAVLSAVSLLADSPGEALRWQRHAHVATALLPGIWLSFSLTFARANDAEFVKRWRAIIAVTLAVPAALALFPGGYFFDLGHAADNLAHGTLRLGVAGYWFYLFFLLVAVVVLVQLERTLRSSTGALRWSIKFMLLGVGSLFGVRIYTCSEALLFARVDRTLLVAHAAALIVANALMIVSLVRTRVFRFDIYLSHGLIYNSLTILLVGVYLLVVGVLAKAAHMLGNTQGLPLGLFFVFLAVVSLTMALLSDDLRHRLRRLVSRHFRRPSYDYRKIWATFTEKTASVLDARELSATACKLIAETFGVSSVAVWLLDPAGSRLDLCSSTFLSPSQAKQLASRSKGMGDVIQVMCDRRLPVDFESSDSVWVQELKYFSGNLREYEIRYAVSLFAGGKFLGVLTLNGRQSGEGLSVEDFDLLKALADQTAGILLNLQLSEELRQAKEKQALKMVSAFFLHDLKNLASTLSMTMQNLPVHFDNPEFRQDALRVISLSVDKINAMCNRLSLLGQEVQLQQTETDVNDLVRNSLHSVNASLNAAVVTELNPVPRVSADPEQFQKVILNLLLNAYEASGKHGPIRLVTEHSEGCVVLSVLDNGCGMSRDFVQRALFLPFQTTKLQGSGIGLYQSKMIVEAHKGKIEVESEEGRGSTFRVILPVPKETGP